jgi:hypothetical protein
MYALRSTWCALRLAASAAGLLTLAVLAGPAAAQSSTAFDINVEANTGETRVVNYTGITRICRRDDIDVYDPNDPERLLPRCVETQSPCTVSVVRGERGITEYKNPGDRNRELNWYFDWFDDQSNLLVDFQVDTEGCGDTSLPDPTYIPSPTPPKPKPVSPG